MTWKRRYSDITGICGVHQSFWSHVLDVLLMYIKSVRSTCYLCPYPRLQLQKRMLEISSPPIGVAAALESATPTRTALSTFYLVGRVALVTGGHRGIGLEIALALVEAGAVVYCLDLPKTPDENWFKVQRYAAQLPSLQVGTSSQGKNLNGRLEYVSADVTKQTMMWAKAEDIAKSEGRLDICVANAGILRGAECLDYPGDEFQQVCYIQVPLRSLFFSLMNVDIYDSLLMSTSMVFYMLRKLLVDRWKGSVFQAVSL